MNNINLSQLTPEKIKDKAAFEEIKKQAKEQIFRERFSEDRQINYNEKNTK